MDENKPALGFIGLGLMGSPMTRNWLKAGYEVAVWNRSAAKMAPLVEAGAVARDSARAVAGSVDILGLCVTDSDAVQAVLFGEGGIFEVLKPGQIVVDFSSIRPDVTRDIAARMKTEKGAFWVDAPVSGGVPGAEAGTLVIMAGGEAEAVERTRPVLEPLCSRLTHMGPSSAGQTTKLANQIIVGCNLAAIAEAVLLAEGAGVETGKMFEALKGGFADSLPFQIFGPRMAARQYDPPLAAVGLYLKDLGTAQRAVAELYGQCPMTDAALDLMRKMAARGEAGLCASALPRAHAHGPDDG